ncbi:MAG: flagellar hook-associated protein FlgK [Armatimonadota bacterium]
MIAIPNSVLELAKNTLLTQQAAIQVIGHNVSNAQTEGYVRQVPVLQPIPGATRGPVEATIGNGAIIGGIKRLQNSFLAVQKDQHMALLGREKAQYDMLRQVETIMTEVGETGLADSINQLFASFEQVGVDPTSIAARQEVIARAGLVADILCGRQENLQDLRQQINEQLGDDVREANRLGREIAALNRKVAEATTDAVRNDLKGRREAAMTELSRLTGAYAIQQENDQIDVLIGGRRLVQLNEVIELGLETDPANPGMQRVVLGSVSDPEGLGGSIQGHISARDGEVVTYMARLDTLAQTLADEINALHSAGFDLRGDAGDNFFEYDPDAPASSLNVLSAVADDPHSIAASADSAAPGDGSNAFAISQIRAQGLFASGEFNVSEFYAGLIGQIGSDAKAAAEMVQARESVVNNLSAHYESLSGVNLDEEAANLLRYQQIYNAATRLVNVSVKMMDALLAIQ